MGISPRMEEPDLVTVRIGAHSITATKKPSISARPLFALLSNSLL